MGLVWSSQVECLEKQWSEDDQKSPLLLVFQPPNNNQITQLIHQTIDGLNGQYTK